MSVPAAHAEPHVHAGILSALAPSTHRRGLSYTHRRPVDLRSSSPTQRAAKNWTATACEMFLRCWGPVWAAKRAGSTPNAAALAISAARGVGKEALRLK